MTHKERWLYRCKCGSCGAILWTDRPIKTVCICSATALNADGTITGPMADDVTDEEMIAFIKSDWNLSDVTIEHIVD